MLQAIVSHSIFFIALFTALQCLRGLLGKAINPPLLMVSVLRASGAIIYFYAYFNVGSYYMSPGILNHLYVPVTWFLAPSMYWLCITFVEKERSFTLSMLLPYVPGLLLTLIFVAVAIISPGQFDHLPTEFFEGGPLHWLDVALIAGLLYGFLMYGMIWHYMSQALNFDTLRREGAFRVLVAVILGGFLGTIFFLVAYLMRHLDWIYYACSLLGIYTLFIWVSSERHPDFEARYSSLIQKARKQSRLEGVDQNALRARLLELMEEKLYLNENLSVSELAGRAGIKPYQLSEFLNRVEGTNFARFVNGFRVQEAARLLIEEPDASVISIAYQCGFNSKANFNLAFKNELGISPSEYIRKHNKSS
jgi:AraC-like DNA-binding protein